MKAIKIDKNHDVIQSALDLVNGRSKAHTFSAHEIFDLVKRFDREFEYLSIPKTKRSGAKIYAISGDKLPSAYKYSRTVNSVTIERRASGFYLVDISCKMAWQEEGIFRLFLTEAQDQIAKKALITWGLCA